MLDLRKLKDLDLDPTLQQRNCAWKLVETRGDSKPGCLAHHTSNVYNDKMYLFGGSNLESENNNFYSLDLGNFRWELMKPKGDLPHSRDEHTSCINEFERTMVIFGGFCDGYRTNEIVKYHFTDNRWSTVQTVDPKPISRSGHSAIIFNSSMYVFGGKDEDNNKLNDLWSLDLSNNLWKQIQCPNSVVPTPRSGHSCDIFENYMVIFGGIQEITKELNDFCLFDLKQNTWITLFEQQSSAKKRTEGYTALSEASPIGGNSPKRYAYSPHGKNASIRKKSPPKTANFNSK